MPRYRSPEEFREVTDRTFALMRDDPEIGPGLRAADAPQRFEFTDVDLVLNVRAGAPGEPDIVWEWSEDVAWRSKTEIAMTTDIANRFFQGKVNVPLALARRQVRIGGDLKLALTLVPITRPLGPKYRAMLVEHYPHLLA